MRILAITSLYPRYGNPGTAPFNRLQFDALAQTHEVAVIAPVAWAERLKSWGAFTASRRITNDAGVRVYHPTYFYPPRFLRSSYGRFFLWSIRRLARKVISEFRPDAILACWAHPDGWAAVRIAREAGLPVLIKVIGSDVLIVTKDSRRRARVAETLRGADAVVAVSRDLAERVIRLGTDPERVKVIYEGINQQLFTPGHQGEARDRVGIADARPVLLFVGNLLLSKGAGIVIEACRLLRDRGVSFYCHMVGGGAETKAIQSMIDRFSLSDRVVLTGPRPQEGLPDWYRAADLVILPSFSEGIPNVLREAVACGRPFVATSVGGIPEITREPAGRLVPHGDPLALAGAIRAFFNNPPTETAVIEATEGINISWEESARLVAEQIQQTIVAFSAASREVPASGGRQ
jgi:glycosyltransferase involved in cell wall biosynthesis